jgi:hypothetical protein
MATKQIGKKTRSVSHPATTKDARTTSLDYW